MGTHLTRATEFTKTWIRDSLHRVDPDGSVIHCRYQPFSVESIECPSPLALFVAHVYDNPKLIW